MIRFRALGFGLLTLLAACTRHVATHPPESGAEEVAAKYFTALGSSDCVGITSTSGGNLAKEIATNGCAASLAIAKEHHLVFVATENLRVDGRDPNARLIDVRLQSDGKEKRVIARVEQVGDAWKVVTL